MAAEFNFEAIKADGGNYLVVAPTGRQWSKLFKTISTVDRMIATKLRGVVEGKRVSWRRPKELGSEAFIRVRKAVDTLSLLAQGPKSQELCETYLTGSYLCWDRFLTDTYSDGTFSDTSASFAEHAQHSKDYNLISVLDDDTVAINADYLKENYPSEWHMWMDITIDGARPKVLSRAELHIETARWVWDDIAIDVLVDCYTCAICEQSHYDGNLISKHNPPPELRDAISGGPKSVEYRIMLSREMQKNREKGMHFRDVSEPMRQINYGSLKKDYQEWCNQQSRVKTVFSIQKDILFAEDPNVLLDFKMRFG